MGIRKLTVTICDKCQKQKPVSRWRITHNGVTRQIDLCADCSTGLVALHAASGDHDLFRPVDDDVIAEARRRRAELEP